MSEDSMPASLDGVGRAKGGNARAKAMSPEERREAAKRAADARWSAEPSADDLALPQATHMGVLKIGDTEIPCAVLESGERVLTERAFLRAMGRDARAKSRKHIRAGDAVGLPPFMTAKALEPYIERILRAPSVPIRFRLPEEVQSRPALGYRAELLPEVCRIFVAAAIDGKLTKQQEHIAAKCQLLLDALANIGIIALVDEATGFQAERDRHELQRILAAYINEELLPWTRRFPDSYYQEMFKLLNWQYSPPDVKRPRLIGKFTDEWVYKQLPPGVRDKLREKNPPNEKGHRRYRHHQLLTEDVGNPHLQNQITAVTTLMRASRNLREFRRLFQNAFPKPNTQLRLPGIPEPEDDD